MYLEESTKTIPVYLYSCINMLLILSMNQNLGCGTTTSLIKALDIGSGMIYLSYGGKNFFLLTSTISANFQPNSQHNVVPVFKRSSPLRAAHSNSVPNQFQHTLDTKMFYIISWFVYDMSITYNKVIFGNYFLLEFQVLKYREDKSLLAERNDGVVIYF